MFILAKDVEYVLKRHNLNMADAYDIVESLEEFSATTGEKSDLLKLLDDILLAVDLAYDLDNMVDSDTAEMEKEDAYQDGYDEGYADAEREFGDEE